MGEYIEALLWYGSWPLVIWIAYRFVLRNLEVQIQTEYLDDQEQLLELEIHKKKEIRRFPGKHS